MHDGQQHHPDMDAHPPNFSYNVSAWRQRIPLCLLATTGAAIAGYMSLYQLGLIDGVWDPFFGDGAEQVLTSDLAGKMDGVLRLPDALVGSWGYLSEAVFALAGSTRRWQYRPWMVLLFGIDVIPLGGVSALLVASQGFIVGHWCGPCLVSALISFILIAMAYDEVWASLTYLHRVWKRTHDRRLLWRVFWGGRSDVADEVALVRT